MYNGLKKTLIGITAVNGIPIVKYPVFSQMDPAVAQVVHVNSQFFIDQLAHIHMEHFPVMGQRNMHISSLTEKGRHQTGRNIGHTARLGVQMVNHIAHAFGQISDFRCHHQDPWIFTNRFVHDLYSLLKNAVSKLPGPAHEPGDTVVPFGSGGFDPGGDTETSGTAADDLTTVKIVAAATVFQLLHGD